MTKGRIGVIIKDMIKALFKFAKIPTHVNETKPVVIDTTSNSGEYRDVSPFVLPAPPAKNFENLWQFSKVYPEHVDKFGYQSNDWYKWRKKGWATKRAIRYPMGKITKNMSPEEKRKRTPLFSHWKDEKLSYIQARKKIYAPEYAKNVGTTTSYHRLEYVYQECLAENRELILLDYDAYDHAQLGMSLVDVINNPGKKMGHAFVLIMMLTGLLGECVNS